MLTLKEPIQLQSSSFVPTVPEAFHEKILGNYALLGARFGPKDLLFLLTAPPELPDDLGGMTTLHLQTEISDTRSVTLDVVNHVVNRILLSQSAGFTYQDQVYVTTALQKLGITDVAQFMGEFRALREGERSVSALLRLYREEARRPRSLPAGEDAAAPAPVHRAPQEEAAPAAAPRYFLHSHIYRRLGTGDIYAALNAYRQNLIQVSPAAKSQFLRLSEELRVSNLLALSELRAQTFRTESLTLSQRFNHYELGDLLPPPAHAGEVLSQAAEAALYSTLEHVLVQNLSRSFRWDGVWQDLRTSLSQTVENTLSRYESYHSETTRPAGAGARVYYTLLTGLYREEARLLRTLRETRTDREARERAPEVSAPGGGPTAPARLEHLELTREGEASESTVQVTEQNTSLSTRDIAQITKRLLQAGAPPSAASAPDGSPAETLPGTRRETRLEHLETVRAGETGEHAAPTAEAHTTLSQSDVMQITKNLWESAPPVRPASSGTAPAGPEEERLGETRLEKLETSRSETLRALRELSRVEGELASLLQEPAPVRELLLTSARAARKREAPPPAGAEAAIPAQGAERPAGESPGLPPVFSMDASAAEPSPGPPPGYPPEALVHRLADERAEREREGAPAPGAETVPGGALPGVTPLSQETEDRPADTGAREGPAPEGAVPRSGGPGESSGSPAVSGPAALLLETLIAEAASPEGRPPPPLIHPADSASAEEEALQAPAPAAPIPAGEVLRRERERLLEQIRETGRPAPEYGDERPAAPGGVPPTEREPISRTPSPAEGEDRERLLLRELSALDRRNREVTERLREGWTEQVSPAAPASPDRSRTMADALRAIDAPQQVLRELLERPAAPEHPRTDPERELLLRHADQTTRTLLEQAMRYERDPEAAARQGPLRPGALGAFNAEGARQRREELEFIARREESSAGGGGAGTNPPGADPSAGLLRPAAGRTPGPEAPAAGRRAPVRFVHKQAQAFLSETLLTRLEEQRAAALRRETAAETVTRTSTTEAQINDLSRQVAAQPAEDISALVSRTLARQMGSITDRVYQQMEKRLQTERFRRGRF